MSVSEDKAQQIEAIAPPVTVKKPVWRRIPNKLRQLWGYRELLYVLTLRGIQIRYKQSILGIAWAVIQPLSLMLIFSLVFSSLLKVPSEGIPYAVFAYSALLFWTFLSGSLNRAIPSLEENSALIKKIYFPREFFPMSNVLAAIFDLLIASIIFLGLMFYYDVSFTPYMLYVVPLFLIQLILIFGVSFIFSALNAYYRDIKHALPLIIQVWMYLTPIIYPLSLVPERFKDYYMLNPMTPLIESYRNVLVKGIAPEGVYLLIAAGEAVFLFILGYLYFKRIEMTIADVV